MRPFRIPTRVVTISWAATSCLLAVAGCGGPGVSPPSPAEQSGLSAAAPDGRGGLSPSAASPIAPSGLPTAPTAPTAPAAAFSLVGADGAAFESSSLAGKVWLGSIFFANCPGTCFRENQSIADILAEIDDPDFVAVSITCDPENDTPAALSRYAERFRADPSRWKFLTGEMDRIKEVAAGTLFLPAEVGVHSERGVVFDRTGRLRGSYLLLQEDRVALLKNLVRELLAEPTPTERPEEPVEPSSIGREPP